MDGAWSEIVEKLPHKSPDEEREMEPKELNTLLKQRNAGGTLPLVNYTSQYGFGCFEGLKAYPQKNGSLGIFRADANARRFYNSMEGLRMPPFPQDMFVDGVKQVVSLSKDIGFRPHYDEEWEKNNYLTALGVYIRPFTHAEGGFGVNLSHNPKVIIVASEVGNFFNADAKPSILVSNKVRATPNGTGWIKAASNYVISSIAKNEAIEDGYTECMFLDSREHKFVEECSSCNVFFVLNNGTVVTPDLHDTILPGITRDSVITLLKDKHIPIEERSISIEEVFDSAVECFSTGTAVGVSYFASLDFEGKTKIFGNGNMGAISQDLLITLKRIQYGLIPNSHNWVTMV